MAFRLALPFRTPLAIGIGLSAAYTTSTLLSRPHAYRLACDNGGPSIGSSDWSRSRDSQTPVLRKGRLNPGAVRQMSSGSILGLIAGLAVSTFSKTLALILGLFIVGAQYAASKGFNIIPYERIQGYIKGVDMRSAVEDNVAFKIAFGSTFALAAFAPM